MIGHATRTSRFEVGSALQASAGGALLDDIDIALCRVHSLAESSKGDEEEVVAVILVSDHALKHMQIQRAWPHASGLMTNWKAAYRTNFEGII